MSLFLASQSPRRQDLLQQIGVEFTVVPINVDESPLQQGRRTESASDLVQRLAALKALTGGQRVVIDPKPVLGADTVVSIDGEILGKPTDLEHAKAMLSRLSGRTHQVLSAVSICWPSAAKSRAIQQQTELSITEVTFRPLKDSEIENYSLTGEAMGKAGSYAIQGKAALFVTQLKGSYSGVVGLPLEKLFPLLERFEVPYWQY